MQNFVAIGPGVSAPQIRDFDVVPVRKCLLGVRITIFDIDTLKFRKTAIFGTDFDWVKKLLRVASDSANIPVI